MKRLKKKMISKNFEERFLLYLKNNELNIAAEVFVNSNEEPKTKMHAWQRACILGHGKLLSMKNNRKFADYIRTLFISNAKARHEFFAESKLIV